MTAPCGTRAYDPAALHDRLQSHSNYRSGPVTFAAQHARPIAPMRPPAPGTMATEPYLVAPPGISLDLRHSCGPSMPLQQFTTLGSRSGADLALQPGVAFLLGSGAGGNAEVGVLSNQQASGASSGFDKENSVGASAANPLLGGSLVVQLPPTLREAVQISEQHRSSEATSASRGCAHPNDELPPLSQPTLHHSQAQAATHPRLNEPPGSLPPLQGGHQHGRGLRTGPVRSSISQHVPVARLPQPGQSLAQKPMPARGAQARLPAAGGHPYLPPLVPIVPAHPLPARRKPQPAPPPRRIVPDTEAPRNVDTFVPKRRKTQAPLPPLARLAPRQCVDAPQQTADTGLGNLQTQPFASHFHRDVTPHLLPTSALAAQAPAQVDPHASTPQQPASQASSQELRRDRPSPSQQTNPPLGLPAPNQPFPAWSATAQTRPQQQQQQPISVMAPEPVMRPPPPPPPAGHDTVDDETSSLGGFTYTPGTYTTDYSALMAPMPWLRKSPTAPRAPPPPAPPAAIPVPPTPYGPQQYTYIAPPLAQVQPYTMTSQQFPVLEQQYMQSPDNTPAGQGSSESVDARLDKLLVSIIEGGE